ncbi:MAG: hypothetical protein Q9P14_13080 [candidate division KSB1 bacterium]|nr:hypothetical protein [candidate division KSB1 bacterium]MDQ7065983.1 hypothetical protein [candidate division KSB1 bacterium]
MFLMRDSAQSGVPIVTARLIWERSFIMVAVILTAVGLMLLERVLEASHGAALARIGATSYFFAAIVLVTAEATYLALGTLPYPLVVVYVVLALLAQAAIGAALLHSTVLPHWIGWVALGWNLVWLVVLPMTTPGDIYYPILHHLIPVIMGLSLLGKRSSFQGH